MCEEFKEYKLFHEITEVKIYFRADISPLRLNFLQKWKKIKIRNSRDQENFFFTFVSS